MEAVQTANSPEYESIRAILREITESQKENAIQLEKMRKQREEDERIRKEDERIRREEEQSRREEDERIRKEEDQIRKENERIRKESEADFDTRIGSLTNLFGKIAEHMVAPKLREKFTEFGLDFPKINPNAAVNDRVNKICLEIDVMLENGDKAMLVEVKTKLTVERINKHIERLEKMRNYANLHGDKRTFLGAVAGVVVTDEVRNYALNQGFFVIEPEGQNLNITPPSGKPREF
jgi:hypothetical protein